MFAIRYCTTTGAEKVIESGNRDATAIQLGKVIYAARSRGLKLKYATIVACRKRPGTKPLFHMSRNSMTEEQLRHWCKYFHAKAYAA